MTPIELAQKAAMSFWRVNAGFIAADVGAAMFPWSRLHTFFIAIAEDRRKLLVSVDPSQHAYAFEPLVQLNRSALSQPNLIVTNSIFLAESVRLPASFDLPWTLRNMLAGLGGWVASRAFFDNEKSALHMWTANGTRDGSRLFERFCAEPTVQNNGTQWRTAFNYFNLSGGVEAWTAEETVDSIGSFSVKEVAPARTFLVPYA